MSDELREQIGSAARLRTHVEKMIRAQDDYNGSTMEGAAGPAPVLGERATVAIDSAIWFVDDPVVKNRLSGEPLYNAVKELAHARALWLNLDRQGQDTSGAADRVRHALRRCRAIFHGERDPGSYDQAPYRMVADLLTGGGSRASTPSVPANVAPAAPTDPAPPLVHPLNDPRWRSGEVWARPVSWRGLGLAIDRRGSSWRTVGGAGRLGIDVESRSVSLEPNEVVEPWETVDRETVRQECAAMNLAVTEAKRGFSDRD